MDVARKHQLAIARKTLRMSVAGARIMGGMNHETAYQIVFGMPLRDRLESLVARYGETGPYSWELGMYGWDNAADLLAELPQQVAA